MTPQRIQRKRVTGWKAPANTLNVTRPGAHENPFPIIGDDRDGSLLRFRIYLDEMERENNAKYRRLIEQVRAADYIMCFCPLDKPCHGDIWIERAEEAE